jgi:thiamine-phosphate pyrophosphorylase
MENYSSFVEHAVRGGVTMVQLREKSDDMKEVRRRALILKRLLRPLGIPLIINDYVELAADIDADGVHIGPHDMSVLQARALLGEDKIIGVSIESLDDLHQVNHLLGPYYYVTASAVYPSTIKPDCKKIWGVDGLKKVIELSEHPVTGMGGIRLNNIKPLIDAGAVGIAVISAIHDSLEPFEAAFKLRQEIDAKE